MDQEDTIQQLLDPGSAQALLVKPVSRYMSIQEAIQILERFRSDLWIPNVKSSRVVSRAIKPKNGLIIMASKP